MSNRNDAFLTRRVAAMAVATVIGLAYYLSWAAVLFQRPVVEERAESARSAVLPMQVAVGAMLVVTVALSVAPSLALGLLERL